MMLQPILSSVLIEHFPHFPSRWVIRSSSFPSAFALSQTWTTRIKHNCQRKNLFDVHRLFKHSSVLNELQGDSTGDVVSSNSFDGRPVSKDGRSEQMGDHWKDLGFSCGVRRYSIQGILDLKLATWTRIKHFELLVAFLLCSPTW